MTEEPVGAEEFGVEQERRHVEEEEEVIRVRIPKPPEVLGMVEKLLGYARMRVRCTDGFTRLCRIPGKYLRRLWVREGDLVIAIPWTIQGNERGDVIYKYTKSQVQWLRNKGHLQKLEEEF